MPAEENKRGILTLIQRQAISLDEVLEILRNACNPEDIFSTTQLDKWAESEGYIKQSNTE